MEKQIFPPTPSFAFLSLSLLFPSFWLFDTAVPFLLLLDVPLTLRQVVAPVVNWVSTRKGGGK